jgi:hypothetical protein
MGGATHEQLRARGERLLARSLDRARQPAGRRRQLLARRGAGARQAQREALAAFRDFLDTYARSTRAGEASAMLGWILIDARAYDETARRFRAAGRRSEPRGPRKRAGCLDALGKRTHQAAAP